MPTTSSKRSKPRPGQYHLGARTGNAVRELVRREVQLPDVSCGDELTEAVGAPAAARLTVLQFGLKEGFLDQRGAKRPRHHPLVGEVTKTKILCRPADRRAGSGYVLDLRVTVEICRRCAAAAVVCTVGWKREGWRRHRAGREGAPKFRE